MRLEWNARIQAVGKMMDTLCSAGWYLVTLELMNALPNSIKPEPTASVSVSVSGSSGPTDPDTDAGTNPSNQV